jgi:hypothetical protein
MQTIPTQFEFKTARDGKSVTFTATPANGKPISIGLPIDVIANMVTGLLGSAQACAQVNKPSAQPFSTAKSQGKLAFAQSNGVALQDITDKPDVIALCFAFGETEIAIGLHRTALQPLGTALMAASADSSRPQ